MNGREFWSNYWDGDWSRALWFVGGIVILFAVLPTLFSIAGGVLRRGPSGLGPFLGHGILAFALAWGAVRVASSFADYFYPGRPPTSIAPIQFTIPDGGAKPPDGQAMAGFTAGVLQQIQALAAPINTLKANVAGREFKAWVEGPEKKEADLYDVIRQASGRLPGLVTLTATAPKEEAKVQVQGTDIGPLINWASTFLGAHNTLKANLTDLGKNKWQIVYNVDAAGLDTATMTLASLENVQAATTELAWDYARRTTKGYAELPALQQMTRQEYELFVNVYSDFAKIINEAYAARIKGVTPFFQPDPAAFSRLYCRAVGKATKPVSCGPESAGAQATVTGHTGDEASTSKCPPEPDGVDSTSLLPSACKWSELSRLLGTVALLAKEDEIATRFFTQAAGLELQRSSPVPVSSRIPEAYLPKVKTPKPKVLGLVTTNPALLPAAPSAVSKPLEQLSASGNTVFVAHAAGQDFESVAYALQHMLGESGADVVVLDVPMSVLAQPAIRYLLEKASTDTDKTANKDARTIFIRTKTAGGTLPPSWTSVEQFVEAARTAGPAG